MKLRIASGLTLPLNTVTQSLAILAKRRAGKSYLARGFAEQLLTAEQQVVIIDPKGDWWGIRSSSDGKSPGFPVVVLGGEHGDLPLEKTAAETVARLIVEERVSVLLDLSDFRKSEIPFFLGGDVKQRHDGMLEVMYRLKAKEEFRTPVMLIVDEADAIAPQKPYPGEERMLGAIEDIVRRGGQRGIGSMLITQRSAVINKNVLTQTQVMVAMRTIAEQDLTAIMGWVDVHGVPEQAKILKASLPALPVGDAWFLSPGWPTPEGIFERIHANPITTFDSGATPEPGQKRIKPKNLADVDLGALQHRMAETIERAKADDPKILRARIAELERDLKRKAPAAPAPTKAASLPDAGALEKARQQGATAVKVALARELKKYEREMATALKKRVEVLQARVIESMKMEDIAMPAMPSLEGIVAEVVSTPSARPAQRDPVRVSPARPAKTAGESNGSGPVTLPTGERSVLTACAQYPEGAGREQLTILTGYKRSTRDAYIQRLRERGFVEAVGSAVFATDAGVAALGPDFEPLPTGEALRAYWLNRLPEGERKILEVLIDNPGENVERDQLENLTGYKRSTRDAYIQRLKARQLVEITGRGEVKASGVLFE